MGDESQREDVRERSTRTTEAAGADETKEPARDMEARIRERRAKLRRTVAMLSRVEAELWEQDAHLEELLDDVRGPSRENQANGQGRGREPSQLDARLRELEWEHRQINDVLEAVEETVGTLHGKSETETTAEGEGLDEVSEAGRQSFPASDPPAFT